jgi:hypothetical protein
MDVNKHDIYERTVLIFDLIMLYLLYLDYNSPLPLRLGRLDGEDSPTQLLGKGLFICHDS